MKVVSIILSALTLLLPFAAHSETRKDAFELSPFLGYNVFQKKQNLKNSFMYGGRLGYNLWKQIGIETSFSFIKSQVDDKTLIRSNKGQFISPKDTVNLTIYDLDLLYNIMPDAHISPFLVLGYGAVRYGPRISNKDMSGFNVGVGAKFWVSENIGFRLDLRDFIVGETFKETYHNINASVGVIFALGPKSSNRTVAQKRKKKIIVRANQPKAVETITRLADDPEEAVVILAFEDVHFAFGKSTLNEQAKTLLKRSIQTLKNNPNTNIRIAGYTSASGTTEYNQGLSERRATAVKDFLIAEGLIKPDRLSIIGYGDTRPAEYESAPDDQYSDAAKANMRVLFEIVVQ